MKRPWQIWLVFFVCVTSAAAGMVWLTRQALEADRLRRVAEAEAELEQRVSLALWRMDTELAPIIAEEVIRPPAAYRAEANGPIDPPPYVLLQFQAWPGGAWTSPQESLAYAEAMPRVSELAAAIDVPSFVAQLPSTPLPTPAAARQSYAANQPPNAAELADDDIFGPGDDDDLFGFGDSEDAPVAAKLSREDPPQFFVGNTAERQAAQVATPAYKAAGKTPIVSKDADFELRGKRYQTAVQQNFLNRGNAGQQQAMQSPAPPSDPELVGVSRPLWVGERLLLARRVTSGGETVVQGAWLDWPRLQQRLLAEVADVLPSADLVPVNGDAELDPGRMLAGLPVRLVVGERPHAGAIGSTLGWALWLGWGAAVLAVAAAAVLLAGVMTLSERRAAFVSSVTHELRTPLTTFRMYAEMLARGMVPDAQQRQDYFETLQRESERLTLLVENVLAYARLERGRRPQAQDRVTLAGLLERIGPRLAHRAAQADMQCDVQQLDAASARDEFTTDTGVVEQILFNLVDNAAKYARGASDRRVHVEAGRNGTHVRITVRDHGPGITQRPWSRRSRPFGKSAQESAESAPGVGLGLALCRRLARQLGGRLEIDTTPGGGAAVSLVLPTN